MYLIRAEARVRNNQIELASADLNLLRKKRWKSNYQDLTGNNALNVLKLILQERQRELAFRGIRWTDLRRLNKDDQFAVTLTRTMDGTTYKLLPNDKKYVIPIDEEELRLGGIEQNER
ncbi:SusD family protein [compost metagenome]